MISVSAVSDPESTAQSRMVIDFPSTEMVSKKYVFKNGFQRDLQFNKFDFILFDTKVSVDL